MSVSHPSLRRGLVNAHRPILVMCAGRSRASGRRRARPSTARPSGLSSRANATKRQGVVVGGTSASDRHPVPGPHLNTSPVVDPLPMGPGARSCSSLVVVAVSLKPQSIPITAPVSGRAPVTAGTTKDAYHAPVLSRYTRTLDGGRPVAVRLRLPAPAAQPAGHRQQRPDHGPLRVHHVRGIPPNTFRVIGRVSEPVSDAITRRCSRVELHRREHVQLRQQGLLDLGWLRNPELPRGVCLHARSQPRSPDRDSPSTHTPQDRNDNSYLCQCRSLACTARPP
ncbi:hypothetical protein OK006_10569 [Actinobacteria bacterium OK006]|nr:hypothetical protein OK006_10569 [Actinobacteria bacterium OK006]